MVWTIGLYVLGWVIFVLIQAQNSIRSSSNGLQGKAGWVKWFQAHAVDLLLRAFVSGLFYRYIVHTEGQKLASMGFSLDADTIAGVGGLAANAFLYQIFGLIPGLRVETGEVAPPDATPPAQPAKV